MPYAHKPLSIAMKRLFVIASLAAASGCALPYTEAPSDLPSLSQAAQKQRFAAWQHALEHNRGGETTTWNVSDDVRGSIAPVGSVFSSTYGWCRDYEEAIAEHTKRYRVVGIACRNPEERWLILDVRPFTETGLGSSKE